MGQYLHSFQRWEFINSVPVCHLMDGARGLVDEDQCRRHIEHDEGKQDLLA